MTDDPIAALAAKLLNDLVIPMGAPAVESAERENLNLQLIEAALRRVEQETRERYAKQIQALPRVDVDDQEKCERCGEPWADHGGMGHCWTSTGVRSKTDKFTSGNVKVADVLKVLPSGEHSGD